MKILLLSSKQIEHFTWKISTMFLKETYIWLFTNVYNFTRKGYLLERKVGTYKVCVGG